MKPHPRLRKTIKWLGTAASIVLLAALLFSMWWTVLWFTNGRLALNLIGGYITIVDFGEAEPGVPSGGRPNPRWEMRPTPERPKLGFRPGWNFRFVPPTATGGSIPYVAIPLWIPLTPILTATIAAWRLDAQARRRARAGRCKCDYDLAGLSPTQPCPECGAIREAAA